MVPQGGKGLVKIIKPPGSPEGPYLNISTPPPLPMITSLKNAFTFNC